MSHNQFSRPTKYSRSGKLDTLHITLMGIVLAARIVLSYVPSLEFGTYAEIGVGFIGTAISGILFGPWYGLIISVINDIFTALLHGQQFFLGFTFSAGLAGVIYGWMLWRKPINWQRIFIAVLLITLIINLGFNSLWIKMMFGRAWMAFMPLRIIKNLVSLPINTLLLGLILKNPSIQKLILKYQL